MVSACSPAANPTPTLTSLTIQLNWTHQAQFAGYYVADQKGYYADEGLTVRFLVGGAQIDPLPAVLNGQAQFGTTGAFQLIAARASGKPVRAISTIYRRNAFVLFSLAESGITGPKDFVGKTILVNPRSRPLTYAMVAQAGIAPSQFTEVPDADLQALYCHKIDVMAGFLTNEVLAAQASGHQLNLIFPDDYGVHFYGDTLFSTDDFLAKNPDLALRFLRATLKGWTYAVENPTAVAALVQKYKPDAKADHETAFMTASLPLVNTGQDHIGWMQPAVWAGMEQTLLTENVLTQPVDLTRVYTLDLLQQVYK